MLIAPLVSAGKTIVNSVGKASAAVAKSSIVPLTPLITALKLWRPWRMPETSSEAPRISRMLPITEPIIE